MKADVKLIVGLGNPGSAYRQTRHNAGAQAVEKLAKAERFVFKANRSFQSLVATGKIDGHPVCLVLPQTFMNNSGEAVMAVAKKKKIVPRHILIVCDDVALPLGQMKIRAGGGDGGHRGLASVFEALGSSELPRLRIGIGRKASGGTLSDYVLSRFREEETVIHDILARAAEAMQVWVIEGIEPCMNRFNQKKEL